MVGCLLVEGMPKEFGHSGPGDSNQLCGSAPAMTGMMAGRLDISCEHATGASRQMR
jgi:hypothetical protein